MARTIGYVKHMRHLRAVEYAKYLALEQRRYPHRVRRPSPRALEAECNRALAAINYVAKTSNAS